MTDADRIAALTAELDALAAWACDEYDDGDEQFGRRAGVARGLELLAERDQLRVALRETREALAYVEQSGSGMAWNDVDHYWACSGCGERIVNPWREERHVDHRTDCLFAALARHAGLVEDGRG